MISSTEEAVKPFVSLERGLVEEEMGPAKAVLTNGPSKVLS